ncbi:MAG: hypothetical protein AB9836_12380 [Aminipila sp.]
MEEKNNKWLTPTLKEAPFYYPGITLAEYEKEREYFQNHQTPKDMINYVPLWKQKEGSKS